MKQKLLGFFMLGMLLIGSVYAQDRRISGKVTADDGSPIAGVSVIVVGTGVATQTDESGNYTFVVPDNVRQLEFRSVGYELQTVDINGRTLISATLLEATSVLDEVVVSAGGIAVQKKTVGYASTELRSENIVAARPTNIASGLQGKVPGLRINAVGGGVNPNYRLVLRGMRSLTGNNEALIVLDNVIVPNEVLSNLNPQDIENINVLNGASAAALYGSDASNGALIVTTKKGKKDQTSVTVSHTTMMERVAFYPELQYEFGSGADNDVQIYTPYENQQYGPRFDGVLREIGQVLPNPETTELQKVPYAATDEKKKFWENGITNQTDFSLSTGSDRTTMYLSGQYADVTGTTPGDLFNRATARVNLTREMAKNLSANLNVSYTQNNYDVTTSTAALYDQLLQTPAQIPVTRYKDWRNDPWANPNAYYNAYYNNPYFTAENNRRDAKNQYVVGNIELKYEPLDWLDFTYRAGLSTRNLFQKDFQNIFRYSPYTKAQSSSTTYKHSDIAGSVTDYNLGTIRINSDFLVGLNRQLHSDLGLRATVATSLRHDERHYDEGSVLGLVVPGVFNLGNSTNTPETEGKRYGARQVAVWGDVNFDYKNYLFLQITGRNDWVSTLSPENRSFFYPSVNLSFIPSEAITALQGSPVLDFLKLRAAWSRVGLVNLGSRANFGAYALDPIFEQGGGYPYSGNGGHTLGDQTISASLKPEITTGYEVGFEANWLKNRIQTTLTWYNSRTQDQTVSSGVSRATGFLTYLVNAAKTSSKGIETSLRLVPYRDDSWNVSIGGNYTFAENKVLEVSGDTDELALGTYGGTRGSYAVKGESFPVIKGTTHQRDPQGRIIVDRYTGYPSPTQNTFILGNASPKHILGVDLSVRWKNLWLSGVAEYRGGYYYYFAGTTIDFSGSSIATTWYDRDRFVIPNSSYLDPVTEEYVPNTNITVRDGGPAYWSLASTRTGIDENYVVSGAFWKLRELSLGYDLPQQMLLSSGFIQAARISLQGRNLFILTPKTNIYTDPEYSDGDGLNNGNAIGLANLGQTPPSRYFGLTLSVTF